MVCSTHGIVNFNKKCRWTTMELPSLASLKPLKGHNRSLYLVLVLFKGKSEELI